MNRQDRREESESSAEPNTYSFKCPNCGRDLESGASPFGDGGDFFWCECGVEGYGYYDPQDGHWELSFTIPMELQEASEEGPEREGMATGNSMTV
jgi:predicted RNA-binding Zn-ribbon protein involved in translation (DUF1610 family)